MREGGVAALIPIIKPVMDEREVEALRKVVASGWVTQGPEVAAFEREFAEYVGAPFACAVSSCTAALHLALLAVGIRGGDEVITVSHSFIATANSIRHAGGVPVFVDIDPETYNLNPALLEGAITERTRAILCVHQIGMPCNLAAILTVARRHGLPVIEDAACAVGSEIRREARWERIGKPHGDIACFSFHPRKLLTTGDGGMLTTASREYDAQFRLWRQHGMSIPPSVRHDARNVVFESYECVGYNYRMTDLQAAVGRMQLTRLPEILERRRNLAARYAELLKDLPRVRPPREPEWARSNWQSYCVRLPPDADQRRIMQALLDQGVATRRGVMCAHREPAYRTGGWRAGSTLVESERAQDQCILLPLYHQMSAEEQNYVVAALKRCLSL